MWFQVKFLFLVFLCVFFFYSHQKKSVVFLNEPNEDYLGPASTPVTCCPLLLLQYKTVALSQLLFGTKTWEVCIIHMLFQYLWLEPLFWLVCFLILWVLCVQLQVLFQQGNSVTLQKMHTNVQTSARARLRVTKFRHYLQTKHNNMRLEPAAWPIAALG